jgi:hypothetical protein
MRFTTTGKIDPSSIADLWFKSKPKDNSRTNEMEMYEFVGALSNTKTNIDFIAIGMLLGGHINDEVVYDKMLSDNLLKGQYSNLEKAFGVISLNRSSYIQAFIAKEDKKDEWTGDVLFIMPPMLYEEQDRHMFFSTVQHELRHALDFVDFNNKPIKSDYMKPQLDGSYEVDIDLYSRHVSEARAHSDQAVVLIKKLGKEEAKNVIKNSRFSLASDEMREAMVLLIDKLAEEAVKENLAPVAVVSKAEDSESRELVNHLTKILELFRFRNFIHFKQK